MLVECILLSASLCKAVRSKPVMAIVAVRTAYPNRRRDNRSPASN